MNAIYHLFGKTINLQEQRKSQKSGTEVFRHRQVSANAPETSACGSGMQRDIMKRSLDAEFRELRNHRVPELIARHYQIIDMTVMLALGRHDRPSQNFARFQFGKTLMVAPPDRKSPCDDCFGSL